MSAQILRGLAGAALFQTAAPNGFTSHTSGLRLVNNQHGLSKLAAGEHYHQRVYSGEFGIAGWLWDCRTAAPGVKGYPQILYGRNPFSGLMGGWRLPRPISALHELTATYDYEIDADGEWTVCFDLWIAPKQDAVPTQEVMLWINSTRPVGGPEDADRQALAIAGDHFAYTAYDHPTMGHRLSVANLVGPKSTTANILSALRAVAEREGIPSTHYLQCVEFGVEIVNGTGEVALRRYEVAQK